MTTPSCAIFSTFSDSRVTAALSTSVSTTPVIAASFAPLPVPSLVPPTLADGFLAATTILASSSSATLPDVINSLDEVQGTLSLANGSLTADLTTTPFGPLQETYDLVALATDLNDRFQDVSGTLTLAGGLASGNLIVGDEEFTTTDFEFANLISGFVADYLSEIDGTVSFANGQIAIDLTTALGDIEGTIGFGNGALDVDLTTPLAPLSFSLDFPDDAQYAFPISELGSDAILNLATGVIEVDLIPFFSGSEVVIPLTALAGTITFDDGIANLSIQAGGGTLDTQFDFAAEVEESLLEFLSTATGTLSVGNGELSANLQTEYGDFSGVLPASQWLNDLIETLPQYEGSIALTGGTATFDLTTPDGLVDNVFDYGQYLDEIASFVDELLVA